MNGPSWKLEDDLETVTITIPSSPPVVVKYKLAEIEDTLKNLGEFRAMMTPEVSHQFPMGQKVMALQNPAWVTEPDIMLGASLIHLRDPRFGWLHYLLPPDEARKLGGLLIAQADTVPPVPPDNKKN